MVKFRECILSLKWLVKVFFNHFASRVLDHSKLAPSTCLNQVTVESNVLAQEQRQLTRSPTGLPFLNAAGVQGLGQAAREGCETTNDGKETACLG